MSAVELDPYVIDTLMPDLVGQDRRPSAFLVYLALWQRAGGSRHKSVAASLRQLAEGTGLSRRAVQEALARLAKRRLIAVAHARATAVPSYTVLRPWVRR